jgi:hypothetical protein
LNALAFLEDLRARGATVEADGSRLLVTPATVLTPADVETWKAHKAEILRALETHQAPEIASLCFDTAPDMLAPYAEGIEAARRGELGKKRLRCIETALYGLQCLEWQGGTDARTLRERHALLRCLAKWTDSAPPAPLEIPPGTAPNRSTVDFDAGQAFEPDAARFAAGRDFAAGRITEEQLAFILECAEQAESSRTLDTHKGAVTRHHETTREKSDFQTPAAARDGPEVRPNSTVLLPREEP